MGQPAVDLQRDAAAIWRAGVDAVDSERLVRAAIQINNSALHVAGRSFPLDRWDRLIVVGAGKAGAGMAAGIEAVVGDAMELSGWVNVPADCVRELRHIRLHAARPAGRNEPCEAGLFGAEQMLRMVRALGPRDICLCLISGGGSALMPLPIEGVTLADKQALTRHLSGAGANIAELNTVRKQLSRLKGGGLAEACQAGALATLIISDVIGDPLDIIASGPTVMDTSTPADAIEILDRFDARRSGASDNVWSVLERRQQAVESERGAARFPPVKFEAIIGNNQAAVSAAADEAARRGYRTCAEPATGLEGDAGELGIVLAERAMRMRKGETSFKCLISGGEPTVSLAPSDSRGKGGRNQQLAAAALETIARQDREEGRPPCEQLVLLSGGTDGEDGPTDAAGAWIGESLAPWSPEALHEAIQRNDTYHFFEPIGGLLQTGPTHTNVCDVRIVLTG